MRLSAVVATVAAVLSACAAVKPAQKEAVLRVDPPAPPAVAPPTPSAGRISLAPVTAAGTASGRRYAYIDPGYPREVHQAASLFWEEPPPTLVQRALERGLSARLGTPVLTLAEAAAGTRRLVVNVDRFEEQSGPSASAFVALTATVVDGRSRELVSTACYAARRPIASADPSVRAQAFEAALGTIMDDMARDLRSGSPARQATAC